MRKILAIALFLTLSISGISNVFSAEVAWSEIKDKHFVVYFERASDKGFAEKILRRAEAHYEKIGAQIGYTRTNKFWTWDDRVKIFLFGTQESFLKTTGQPAWSGGYAARDSQVFQSKTIVTFRQENDFEDGLLPHEISHLILHDFVQGASAIPIWFDEGVAQLNERDKVIQVSAVIKHLVIKRSHMPLGMMASMDVRKERDPNRAAVFYAQSLSVVDFLLKKYGQESFGRLCRYLRDGNNFDQALNKAYSGAFKDWNDLEKKWIASL